MRHADEQLFALLVPDPPAPARIRPRRGPIALALAGLVPLAFGAWVSFAGERPQQSASVGVAVTPIAATIFPDPARPTPLVAEYAPRALEAHLQPTRRAAASGRSAVVASPTIVATVAPRKVTWEAPRRHVPRPLSPGEFGRR